MATQNSSREVRVWRLAAVSFLCWAIVTTSLAAFYYGQYSMLEDRVGKSVLTLEIVLDYGNGTTYRTWHHDVAAVSGESLLSVTSRLAELNYTMGGLGAFVVSINGVKGNSTHGWLWYRWDSTEKIWILGETGCDKYLVADGDLLIWSFTAYSSWPPPLPEPP